MTVKAALQMGAGNEPLTADVLMSSRTADRLESYRSRQMLMGRKVKQNQMGSIEQSIISAQNIHPCTATYK